MTDLPDYIEAYFKNQLNDTERRQFEERCERDDIFAREVAFYITASEGIRQKLLEEKKHQWSGDEINLKKINSVSLRTITLRKWLPYVAAACFLIAVGIYSLYDSRSPHDLASKYISEHYIQLSQTMDASNDSMQQGIAAYNNKDYGKALQLFENIYQSHPEKINAKKYIGLVYLVTKDYDKAIRQFDELAKKPDIYKNPGFFLKSITLLERNNQGDKAEAKQLMEQIVNQKAEGSVEAKKWLEKW